MVAEFVSCRYKKSVDEAKNHVRYIAYRERSTNEKYGMFNDRYDHVDVNTFLKEIDHPKTAHPQVAKVHTLIFTMSEDEWKRSYFEDGDYKKMVRDIMRDWQLNRGISVKWSAAEHREKGHPHVHVVILSVYKDRDGIERRLKVTPEDKKWFKKAFHEEKNRIRGFDLPSRPIERDLGRNIFTGRNVLDSVLQQIQQKMREEELKRQLERDRD